MSHVSDEDDAAPRPAAFEETKTEIRFALSQLAANNRHHEFEHLTRASRAATITRNILPATGPVSAGGDQARDFETYRSEFPGQVREVGQAIGLEEGDRVGFTCTIQQDNVASKFASDVETIIGVGTDISFVVAYSEANVAVAARHRFQQRMLDEHAIHVELFDGTAIAELLAQQHTFWIAEQYLHLPARILPPTPDHPDWYNEDRHRWQQQDDPVFSMGHLVDLTSCLRYATRHEDAAEDLPFWLTKMELLLDDDVPEPVQSKAQYEIAIAQLLGLGDMRPADSLVEIFIDRAIESDEPSVLQDAAALVMYSIAAKAQGLTAHANERLVRWNTQLRERVDLVLDDAETPGRQCALLSVLAYLRMQPDLEGVARARGVEDQPAQVTSRITYAQWADTAARGRVEQVELPLVDKAGALDALMMLVDLLPQAPLFPVKSIADALEVQAGNLVDDPRYDRVVVAIDARIADVEGRSAAAERARDRAMRFLDSGRLLDALREIHRARAGWFSGEASRGMILATLVTSEIYSRLRLYAAAKYYALVAASILQERELDLFPRALFKASFADYHQGAWFSAMQLAERAVAAHGLIAQQPFVLGEHEELVQTLFAQRIIKAAADKAGGHYAGFVSETLEAEQLTEFLDQVVASETDSPWWDSVSAEEFFDRVVDELGYAAFSDAGAVRAIRWTALGARWTVEFDNSYSNTIVGERLAAAAQIVIAEVARRDPLLLPTSVTWQIHAVSPQDRVSIEASNDGRGTTWHVRLPVVHEPSHETYEVAASGTLALVRLAFGMASVRPDDEVEALFHAALEGGLMSSVMFGSVHDVVYSATIDEERFTSAARHRCSPIPLSEAKQPYAASELDFPDAPGPGYTPEEGQRRARTRYEEIPANLRSTLPVLNDDEQFKNTIGRLRAEGWLDWHLLVAVFNIAKNERLQPISPPRTADEARQMHQRFFEPEPAGDPVDPSVFTADRLREALSISVGSTLQQWGLQIKQNPPDVGAMRTMLERRYGYASDDVPHGDPFDPGLA